MNQHPYLRAYMAGITVPTIFLLVAATAFCIWRYVVNVPVPIERIIVFPMAVVPNAWGVWNMAFLATQSKWHTPIGLHGALLPILLAPLGIAMTGILHFSIPHFATKVFPVAAPIGLAVYYLAWKYLVGFLNKEMGVV